MRSHTKTIMSLFYVIFTIAYPCHYAAAQTQEEMKILYMFYKEKELVVTPTRNPKPISQVAENITVITSQEIEAMNAHTVAEVLNRVTGLFVDSNQDFGTASLLHIQGSEQRHVLVLLDGIQWNFLSDGAAETNSIPVGIIERIEVIKGPASSTWGSSLGGVVNILTKPVGDTDRPRGSISASNGEGDTQDYRGEILGEAGPVGYYLFAGSQESDGLRDSRYFDSYSLYSKLRTSTSESVELGLSMGYSQPNIKLGDFPSQDLTSSIISRNFFLSASLEALITTDLSLDVSFHKFKQKYVATNDSLGLGMTGPPGVLFLQNIFDQETTGGKGKLVWEKGEHTAVFGIDFDHGQLDQTLNAGPLLQFFGVPATSVTHPEIEKWALFANDTIVLGRLSITPGIRYDWNDITGSFLSPSLGITYRLGDHSILRSSVARGFTIPPLSSTSGGGLYIDPNPDLEPEEVWSYQIGAESSSLKYIWAKVTLFRHDLDKALKREPFAGGPPTFNDLIINDGSIRRQGLELELETLPFHHFSFLGGLAYADISPPNEAGSDEMYAFNIAFRYDDKTSFRAEVFGHYVAWDLDPALNARYDDFIWDFNADKKIHLQRGLVMDLFFTAHNLFNGKQYTQGDNKNPQRWVEAGLRMKF
jgi:vitamin B12 transporter